MATALELYQWSTIEKVAQLKDYLSHNTPSSSSNLGFLMNISYFDESGNVDIWTSHKDPLCTSEIVVWIFDYGQGIRLFVNTEFVLDNAELEAEAKDHAYSEHRGNSSTVMFQSKENEKLYKHSLEVCEQVFKLFLKQRRIEEPFFGDVSLLWLPILHKCCQLSLDLPHCRLARQASLPSPNVKIPDQLELTTIATDQDMKTVQNNNKHFFSYEYIKDCSRLSSAIRRKDNNELVAWAMTHPDFSVGAVYVLPEYRRQGLAEAVVAQILGIYKNHVQQQMPDVPLAQLYFNVFIERTNTPSLNLFGKSGFKHIGIGVSRIQIIDYK